MRRLQACCATPPSSRRSSRELCEAALPGAVPAHRSWATKPSPCATSRPPSCATSRSRKPERYVIPPKEQRVAVVGAGSGRPGLRAQPGAEALPGDGVRAGATAGAAVLRSAPPLRRVRRRHRPAVLRGRGGLPLRRRVASLDELAELRRRLSWPPAPVATPSGCSRAGTAAVYTTREPRVFLGGHAHRRRPHGGHRRGGRGLQDHRGLPADRQEPPGPRATTTRRPAPATSTTRARCRVPRVEAVGPGGLHRRRGPGRGRPLPAVRLRRLHGRLRDAAALPEGSAQDWPWRPTPTWPSAPSPRAPLTREAYSCNLCGHCTSVCPEDVDVGGSAALSRAARMSAGVAPAALHDFWLREMDFATTEGSFASAPPGQRRPASTSSTPAASSAPATPSTCCAPTTFLAADLRHGRLPGLLRRPGLLGRRRRPAAGGPRRDPTGPGRGSAGPPWSSPAPPAPCCSRRSCPTSRGCRSTSCSRGVRRSRRPRVPSRRPPSSTPAPPATIRRRWRAAVRDLARSGRRADSTSCRRRTAAADTAATSAWPIPASTRRSRRNRAEAERQALPRLLRQLPGRVRLAGTRSAPTSWTWCSGLDAGRPGAHPRAEAEQQPQGEEGADETDPRGRLRTGTPRVGRARLSSSATNCRSRWTRSSSPPPTSRRPSGWRRPRATRSATRAPACAWQHDQAGHHLLGGVPRDRAGDLRGPRRLLPPHAHRAGGSSHRGYRRTRARLDDQGARPGNAAHATANSR